MEMYRQGFHQEEEAELHNEEILYELLAAMPGQLQPQHRPPPQLHHNQARVFLTTSTQRPASRSKTATGEIISVSISSSSLRPTSLGVIVRWAISPKTATTLSGS